MFNQLNLKQTGPAAPESDEFQTGVARPEVPPSPEAGLRALQHAAPAPVPAVRQRPPAAEVRVKKRARERRVWPAVLAGVCVVAAGLAAASFYRNRTWPEAVLLQAAERGGVLQIEWEGGSGPVVRARNGALEIIEGGAIRKYDLSAAELRKGAFSVIRQGDEVTAKLTLTDPAGGVRQEISRYLGKPVPSKVDPHLTEIETLKVENQTLRSELEKERARASELQSWADVLEASLKKREGR